MKSPLKQKFESRLHREKDGQLVRMRSSGSLKERHDAVCSTRDKLYEEATNLFNRCCSEVGRYEQEHRPNPDIMAPNRVYVVSSLEDKFRTYPNRTLRVFEGVSTCWQGYSSCTTACQPIGDK